MPEASAEDFSERAVENLKDSFKFKYFSGDQRQLAKNPSYIAIGLGGHRRTGKARSLGGYLSGITSIADTNVAIYGRGEFIRDLNETTNTRIFAWKAAIGLGYYITKNFVPYLSLAQCYPTEATCYFVPQGPEDETERDTDSIYLGFGFFFKEPLLDNHFEISIDYTPYSVHHNRSIYLGYAFEFD